MTHADFAVIGGGPAGATAARRLAERGANVILFERCPMPRAKPCGGALSERAIRWLDLPLPASLIDAEVFGARARYRDSVVEVRLPRRVGVLVTRAPFDHFLLTQAEAGGVRVVWAAVKSIDRRAGEVVLATPQGEFTASGAVICEGAGGRLSRAVRRPDGPEERGFCLAADVPAGTPDPQSHIRGIVDVYYGDVRQGYGWVFHHGSYYSVGLGSIGGSFPRPLEAFRRFAAARGIGLDGVRIRGHFLPLGGIRRTLCADRLLLAGDAAGFGDPFHGEGIGYAIRSGQLAADVALDAAGRGDLSRRRLSVYQDLCWEEFERDLRAMLTFVRASHYMPRFFKRSLAFDEEVLTKFSRVPAGELSYRQFLRWLMLRGPYLWLRAPWRRR